MSSLPPIDPSQCGYCAAVPGEPCAHHRESDVPPPAPGVETPYQPTDFTGDDAPADDGPVIEYPASPLFTGLASLSPAAPTSGAGAGQAANVGRGDVFDPAWWLSQEADRIEREANKFWPFSVDLVLVLSHFRDGAAALRTKAAYGRMVDGAQDAAEAAIAERDEWKRRAERAETAIVRWDAADRAYYANDKRTEAVADEWRSARNDLVYLAGLARPAAGAPRGGERREEVRGG